MRLCGRMRSCGPGVLMGPRTTSYHHKAFCSQTFIACWQRSRPSTTMSPAPTIQLHFASVVLQVPPSRLPPPVSWQLLETDVQRPRPHQPRGIRARRLRCWQMPAPPDDVQRPRPRRLRSVLAPRHRPRCWRTLAPDVQRPRPHRPRGALAPRHRCHVTGTPALRRCRNLPVQKRRLPLFANSSTLAIVAAAV